MQQAIKAGNHEHSTRHHRHGGRRRDVVMTRLGIAPSHPGSDLPAGSTVVRLDGDLGIASARALRERLISVLRPGTRLLIVDLSSVQSCDPAGLGVLIGTQRRAKERGIVVCLVAPSSPVAELLHATGLERYLTVCSDMRAGAAAAPQLLAG
jgi:anti-anti-sigma factor